MIYKLSESQSYQTLRSWAPTVIQNLEVLNPKGIELSLRCPLQVRSMEAAQAFCAACWSSRLVRTFRLPANIVLILYD